MKNLRTGDVEIGLGSVKRMAAEFQGWVCEHCGEAKSSKTTPTNDSKPRCKSKAGLHKWRKN